MANAHILNLHTYRVHLIPLKADLSQVEELAEKGSLPYVQFKAPHADYAHRAAEVVTGKKIHRVERIEETSSNQTHAAGNTSDSLVLLSDYTSKTIKGKPCDCTKFSKPLHGLL